MHKNTSVWKQPSAFLFLLVITFLAMPVFKAYAVFVSPSRVYFDDRSRSARVIIYNKGSDVQNVSFSWEHLVMVEGGGLKRLEEGETYPGYQPSDPYIRFSPRRTVLKPGETQKIRMLVQKPGDLAPGEYRSHFRISSEPASPDGAAVQEDEEKFNLAINLRVAKSIPMFLWQGDTSVDVKINKAITQTKEQGKVIHFEFANNSTRSIYTTMMVECTRNGQIEALGKSTTRLYHEAKQIDFDFPANKINFSGCSSVTAKLMGIDDPEFANKIITESSVQVN